MVSKEDLIGEIQRLAKGSKPPTKAEFNDKARYSPVTVWREFGSWNGAVREAGFRPHKHISDSDLLKQIFHDVSGEIAPPYPDFEGRYGVSTIEDRFRWWEACVRAGLRPYERRPLAPTEWKQFFNAATAKSTPERRLIGLLAQFTGLTTSLMERMSTEWITDRDGDVLVTVPETLTELNEEWKFRVPAVWTDHEGEQHDTELPGLLTWYLNQHETMEFADKAIQRAIFRIADEAELESRELNNRSGVGTCPVVRRGDLRVTGGIQMARNGAPASRIRRHLGIEYTGWEAAVDDFLLWCHVHDEDFSHSDSNIDGIYLDPDSGDVLKI